MDDSFDQLLDSSQNLLVLLPTKPFFDQVAAGLSLYLTYSGAKQVQVACPSPMTVEFNRLVGVNRVTDELGSKNLTLRFRDYPADNIERVSYDIEDGQFRLSVIPKPGQDSPKKEQVNLSYSGVSADTAVLVGGANESHFPALSSELSGVKIAHIGTKELVTETKKGIMSFAKPASSVSEIVASFLTSRENRIDADVASNLLSGIEVGSNNFSSGEVTAETFEIVATLMRKGGKRVSKMPEERFAPGSIPGEVPKKKEKPDKPEDWEGPKIYKGTTVS